MCLLVCSLSLTIHCRACPRHCNASFFVCELSVPSIAEPARRRNHALCLFLRLLSVSLIAEPVRDIVMPPSLSVNCLYHRLQSLLEDVTMLSASFFVYCLYHQLQNLLSTLSCSLPLSLSKCLPHRLQSLLKTVSLIAEPVQYIVVLSSSVFV